MNATTIAVTATEFAAWETARDNAPDSIYLDDTPALNCRSCGYDLREGFGPHYDDEAGNIICCAAMASA